MLDTYIIGVHELIQKLHVGYKKKKKKNKSKDSADEKK